VVSNVVTNTDGNIDKLKQLVAIRKFVNDEVFEHPKLRIEQIKQAEETRTPKVGQSRRGML